MGFDYIEKLPGLAANLTVVATALGALYLFAKRAKKARERQLDRSFMALWTNEGDITSAMPTHYIDLEIRCDKSQIHGVLNSSPIQSDQYWHNLSVIGSRNGSKARVEIVNIIRGRRVTFETVILQFQDNHIYWKLFTNQSKILPHATTLWRLEEVEFLGTTNYRVGHAEQ